MQRALGALVVALGLVLAGCGGDDDAGPAPPDPADERRDRPAKPPKGWGTVRNEAAGFTISVPGGWDARTNGPATLIRSPDRLVAITTTADRGTDSVRLPPAAYARQTLEALPGFEGKIAGSPRRVQDSPYRTAHVRARGRVNTSPQPQRISVAVFRKPGQVTYAVVAFRNARKVSRADERALRRMLPTLRGQPPNNIL